MRALGPQGVFESAKHCGLTKAGGAQKDWLVSRRMAHGGNFQEQGQAVRFTGSWKGDRSGPALRVAQLLETRLVWRPGWPSWKLLRPESG